MALVLACCTLLAPALPGPSARAAAAAAPLEVRFYPRKTLHSYEMEPLRHLSSLMLPNAVVINRGSGPVEVTGVELELRGGGVMSQLQRLGPDELDRAAARFKGLADGGLLQAYAFQFRPDLLLGPDVKPATSRTLAPGEALYVGQQVFAFKNRPDHLALRVRARDANGGGLVAEDSVAVSHAGTAQEYDFPLRGRWYVAVAPSWHGHHRWVVPEEFALDIARVGPNADTHKGTGAHLTDYYAYGTPVLAAADGVVEAAVDSLPESDADLKQPGETAETYMARIQGKQMQNLMTDAHRAAGNHVVLRHDGGEWSLYAHLKPGSVLVKPGQAVKRGQPIGRLGNSGGSTEPHLHFQVSDGPDPLLSAGLPIRFRNVENPTADGPRALQSGDMIVASPPLVAAAGPGAGGGARSGGGERRSSGGAGKPSRSGPTGRPGNGDRR